MGNATSAPRPDETNETNETDGANGVNGANGANGAKGDAGPADAVTVAEHTAQQVDEHVRSAHQLEQVMREFEAVAARQEQEIHRLTALNGELARDLDRAQAEFQQQRRKRSRKRRSDPEK